VASFHRRHPSLHPPPPSSLAFQKKHSDITITVHGEVKGDERTFHLHKFPLISKSVYFDDNIPDSGLNAPPSGPVEMVVVDFPGGPAAFEFVAKYCYGIDIELTVDNIAFVYCACRVLRVPDLEKSTEAFMAEVVLRDPAKAAVVLKAGTSSCASSQEGGAAAGALAAAGRGGWPAGRQREG